MELAHGGRGNSSSNDRHNTYGNSRGGGGGGVSRRSDYRGSCFLFIVQVLLTLLLNML